MVIEGLDLFRAHFDRFRDRYVLIGGTACWLAMEEVGLEFRRTKDLDIVLCVEALDAEFVQAFWDFVRKGKYRIQEKSTGEKQFYRFMKPEDESYPFMLELFSRRPDALDDTGYEGHLTPIPVAEEVSSLSAILLDDDYYAFLHQGKEVVGGLPIVVPVHLIPLKAKAWLDLSHKREVEGVQVDQRDITKHKNDIFRLSSILESAINIKLPPSVEADMRQFFDKLEGERVDLKNLGLRNTTVEEVVGMLRSIYNLGA